MKKNNFTSKTKIIFFFINLIIVFIVGYILYEYQINKLKNEFKFNVENVIKKDINNKLENVKSMLRALSKFNQTNQEMTSSSFSIFTKDLLQQSFYVNNIMYSSIVLNKDKTSFETYMKDKGHYTFNIKAYDKINKKFVNTAIEKKYAPIVLFEPSTYEYTKYIGYDIFNNKTLNKSIKNAIKSSKIVNTNTTLLNNKNWFFIKATYFGEDIPSLEINRINNAKGFYIINVNIKEILKEYLELYDGYELQIVFNSNNSFKNIKDNDLYVIENFSLLSKLNKNSNTYLKANKRIHLHDININIIALILFMIILVHLLIVFIVEKNIYVKKELNYKATHDDLTGLTNRNYFKNIINEIIKNHNSYSNKITAILFIDLDKFKDINDTLGHKFGDEVLVEVSKRFKTIMRNNDTICRHGGDEFLIILEDINSIEDIINIIRKIMDHISKPIIFNQHNINLTISMGISLFPNDGYTVDDLLKNADSAMYKAKDEGRNTFKFYTEDMTLEIMQKVKLENDLKEAIINDDFLVFYQAQYNANTNKIIGMEALVRWKNKNNEIISPAKFIPMANETGLIVQLDRLVMNKAIKQFRIWKDENLNPGVLSLNLSMKHLKSEDFIEYLQKTIKEYNFTYKDIELEIIEDEIMINPLDSISKLKEINKYGISIAIDDFGTGHSSLAYLKNLPINKLKIDRAFIKDLPEDNFDIAISKTVIELAKNLNLDIIAEGVETLQQKDFLLKNGCDKMQGYYFAKPMPADEIEILLNNIKSSDYYV